MNRPWTRRRFLRRTFEGGAAFGLLANTASVWGAPANERIQVALVGVGGRGTWFVDTIPRMERVVALCDVDARKLTEAFRRWEQGAARLAKSPHEWERKAAEAYRMLLERQPATFRDFRAMLERMQRDIDAVIVATPDHTHGVISAAAMRAGKHVFCEKPLTRTVEESRKLRKLAREHRVATSMGNQGTASGQFRRALELVREGLIGEVRQVYVWNTGGGADRKEPPGQQPVPDYLDWDLWLGPATFRPYHRDWLRRNLWRDFGTCQLGNWAPHTANLAFMALRVHELWQANTATSPTPRIRVQAWCSGINPLSFPRWEKVQWHVPARGNLPPVTFTWFNGVTPEARETILPLLEDDPALLPKDAKLDFAGTVLVGSKGRIHATGHNATFRLLPEAKFRDIDRLHPQHVERPRGHEQDWFIACRGGKPAWANFDYASALTEFLMLGNVATQVTGSFEFEPATLRIVDHPVADALLRFRPRSGWEL